MQDIGNLIRDMSEIYDLDSQNTYITLYLTKGDAEKFLEKREKICRSLLKGEELKNFDNSMKRIKEFLDKNSNNNVAIFTSYKNGMFEFFFLPTKINNSLIVDSSPYIRPLARIQDEWESFTIVLIDSRYAKIFSISLGKAEKEKNLSTNIMNKHKKGGCSQARFQRLRKGAINKFLKEVTEELKKFADNQIVLAGPGQIKVQFMEMLTKALKDRIVKVIDINIEDEKDLLKTSINFISALEEQKSIETVQQLKEEILKDGLAVYGFNDTLKALKNGQIELLIIEKDYKIKGFICENCQLLKLGFIKKCSNCGGHNSEVDVIEELIEFAKRTDANIEFTDDKEISNLGHIGAILRYK